MTKCAASLLLAFMAVLAIGGVCLAASNCKFGAATTTLNFGNLDPGAATDVTISMAMNLKCTGPPATDPVPFSVSDDDGLYESGPNLNRLRHTLYPAQYLPYSFAVSPSAGFAPRNSTVTLTITGTVKGADYRNAYAGNYTDTVTITITP